MVQFLSIFVFLISSIFVGFFKSSRFLCHPVPEDPLFLHTTLCVSGEYMRRNLLHAF